MSALKRRASSTTPLSHSSLSIAITDLVAEYTLRHVFSNHGDQSIEAVYAFPVPLDAAFLGLTATLAGQTLEARVELKTKAEHDYDDAIAEGHSAVLLSVPEPGLLCVSLGNLKPDEEGEIILRFATSLRMADGCARLNLPLAHRPRYGKWRLDDLSAPTHDFAVEHPLSFDIHATGLLGSSHARCLSHPATFEAQADGQALQLDDALMDRDVAVVFELSQALEPTLRCIVDGDATLGMINIPVPPNDTEAQPLDLVLLLDCSGSMQGDAIVQSQSALRAVTKALSPEDRIQIIRFGSTCDAMFRRPLKATPLVRATIQELESLIQSDMGGTEMGAALDYAQLHIPEPAGDRRRAIILITDGAVQPADIADQQDRLSKLGIPAFVVAVGSTAGVEVLRPLAESTQAVLERAVPMEPIDACVMRLFRRASQPPVSATVTWPAGLDVKPIPMPLAFPGEVLTLAARWAGPTTGNVHVALPFTETTMSLALQPATPDLALRALLGQRQIAAAAPQERAELAVEYGLLTEETSAVLVRYRASDDRGETLPLIVAVPQMASAGMLGVAMSQGASIDSLRLCVSAVPPASYSSCQTGMDPFDGGVRFSITGEEELSESPAESTLETRTLPAIPAERIKEVVLALFQKLVAAYLATPRKGPGPEGIVGSLPASIQEDALELLRMLWLPSNDDPGYLIVLLLAITGLETMPTLLEHEEAKIPLLAHEFDVSPAVLEQLLVVLRIWMKSGIAERKVSVSDLSR